ncbi:hypothetical protein D3C87_1636050 [compost metagenome]
MAAAGQDIVAEAVEALLLARHADAAHFGEALTAPRLDVQIAQIPAAVLGRLVEDEARIAALNFIIARKLLLAPLHVGLEHQPLVADGAV